MQEIERTIILAKNVRSLCWQGDELVDLVEVENRYRLDGTHKRGHISWAYKFDRAAISPDGAFVVLYEVLGTKGLVLKNGAFVREINRSYYCADVYECPITLFNLPNGRTALVHCPEEYNKLEIEDAESGERLTERDNKLVDFFHSRLSVSRDGKYLMSAGWIWHPLDAVFLYDIEQVLDQPELLDADPDWNLVVGMTEIHNAAFSDEDTALFASTDLYDDEIAEDEEDKDKFLLRANQLGHYSLSEKRFLTIAPSKEPLGTLMSVGSYAVGFYQHPKLIEVATGEVMAYWPELETGNQVSSIIHHIDKIPPLALDPANKRFAVADDEKITIIQLG